MKKSPLFEAAFRYVASGGYSIMPLRRNKRPALASWTELQTSPMTDEQIIEYWTKNPNANIGILTGKNSGITVVDIDVPASADEQVVALSAFPPTFTVETPSGGYHLYYAYDVRAQQTANTFAHLPHVDIRNDGGYVVAPPSFCDYIKHKERMTGAYRVIHDIPLARFPYDIFYPKAGKSLVPSSTPTKKQARSILKTMKVMQDGDGRNNQLTKAIGAILRMLEPADYETAGLLAARAANAGFAEPLDDKEVLATFNSIMKRQTKQDDLLPETVQELELLKNEKGTPIANEENVYRILKADPLTKDCVRFNIFTGIVEFNFGRSDGTYESYQRSDITAIRTYLMRTYGFLGRVSHATVEDAAILIAKQNRVSPPHEWLKSLAWDGEARLDHWLHHVYGVKNDAYHVAVASNWMKGLVKRLVQPGCKFDYVLVIEGKQGIRKSTSMAVLGGAWYVETILAPDNKDFFMLFAGKVIVEFSEGETLSRTEAKRLKAIITIQNDKYRVPYERSPQEFPRQCVFAMTTNQDEYLKDETGNRRWLPVKVMAPQADIEWLIENRDQLYAEAYHRVITLKETTYEFPEKETLEQQSARQMTDPREELLYDWYFTRLNYMEREEGITPNQAYSQGIHNGVPFGREMTKGDSMIIGSILTQALKLERRRVSDKYTRYYRYYPTDETNSMAPNEGQLTMAQEAEKAFADHP